MKKIFSIIGLGFLVVPLFGLLWSILRFIAFTNEIHGMDEQSAKTTLTTIMNTFGTATFSGFIGITVLGLVVDGASYRPKWLFWWMTVLGGIWLFNFPAGTMVGIALLIYTLANRRKFRNFSTEPSPSL